MAPASCPTPGPPSLTPVRPVLGVCGTRQRARVHGVNNATPPGHPGTRRNAPCKRRRRHPAAPKEEKELRTVENAL
jgi:hypothetical protein